MILIAGGVEYIRWGRTTCPNTNGTEVLYSGLAAGPLGTQGGGSNHLCLPDEPEYLSITPGLQSDRSLVYGAEYQALENPPAFGNVRDHNIPCAVCYSDERVVKVMIPAKVNCPLSWTREYYGYLMSTHHNLRRETYECVDMDAEVLPNSEANADRGALFYFTEIRCTGTECPSYTEGNELACVVCTK